jgi:hypothetical protein
MRLNLSPCDAAAYCRARGWVRGDLLFGREGARGTTIELRYVGDGILVAKRIREDGKPVDGREGPWSLGCRRWRRVRRATPSRSEENR